MMHQGMDLSRFRKVSSDGKSSTLKHRNGHEMKVAHGGLSPKMREAIDGMPLHLADGTVEGPVVAPPAVAAPEPEVAPAAAPQAPEAATDTNAPIDVIGRRPAPTPQELNAEAGNFAQDVERGHIEPKTMSSLYANKSTLGKIGTIFGLMVGGAGAGLSHQPNALLELMQKELDRDLEAQKLSKEGARNWYQLNMQHEMNQAQQRRLGIENTLTKGQISKIPSDIAATEASTKHSLAGAAEAAANATKTQMQTHLLDHLQKSVVNPMPPGPQRGKAQGTLNGVKQAVGTDISARNMDAAIKQNKIAAANGEPVHAVDYDKLKAMAASAAGGVALPGIDRAMGEAADTEEGRALLQQYVSTVQALNKKTGAGRVNPADRETLIMKILPRMVKHMSGGTDPKLVEEYKKTLFPDVSDVGPTRQDKFQAGIEHFKGLEERTPALNTYGLKTPFPYESAPTLESNPTGSVGGALSSVLGKSKSAIAKEKPHEQYKTVGGIKYKRGPNGEAIPVK